MPELEARVERMLAMLAALRWASGGGSVVVPEVLYAEWVALARDLENVEMLKILTAAATVELVDDEEEGR
jgi:hypothetical protein